MERKYIFYFGIYAFVKIKKFVNFRQKKEEGKSEEYKKTTKKIKKS